MARLPDERSCLSYWHRRVVAAGLPVPETREVRCQADLSAMLDGMPVPGWSAFIAELGSAVSAIGTPCFVRTGHGSGKHSWASCCHLVDPARLADHVMALVEWSHTVDPVGLPTDVWAVRRLIPTRALFTCTDFEGLPVAREFRVFADAAGVRHVQPYWPPGACEEGRPDRGDWRQLLAEASRLAPMERELLGVMAVRAAAACDRQEWSVDFLQDARGRWWLIDMAPAELSYRWGG